MFNGELLADRVAAAKLQISRNREAERRERIFNDKERTIGVDKEALHMQMREKKLKEEAEMEKQKTSDEERLHHSKAACVKANQQQKQQREMAKDMVRFWQQHQPRSGRREYDLNDPEHFKNMHPDEAQMIFPAMVEETANYKIQQLRQREQLRDWLIQQQAENQRERQRQKMDEQNYNQFLTEVNKTALHLQKLEMENRKAALIATKEYNLAMSEEKQRQKLKDNAETLEFIKGQLMDIDSSQNSEVEANERGEMLKLKEFQKQQIEEKKRRELGERNEEHNYNCFRIDSARTMTLIERQQAKLNKQRRQHLDSVNLKLAETRQQLKPDIATGAINESFFSQFNTCSR